MPPTFRRLTIEEFEDVVSRFQFTRRINAVHMHHTWRPNHGQWRGHETIVGMWQFHTSQNGWSDIAQHITIDPAGGIWTGRNWNQSPASASGHNGNSTAGPFMFEMVGDFDVGRDRFEGAQRDSVLRVIASIQRKFGLAPETLRFHREMSTKTCPGSGIDYQAVLADVRALHAVPVVAGARAAVADSLPFPPDALATDAVMQELASGGSRALDPFDAEPAEEAAIELPRVVREGPFERAAPRGPLTPLELAALRPHVINLRQGEFSRDGRFSTSAADVDAIFEEALPRELAARAAANQPLRVLFFAHGGLVSESTALVKAHERVEWWLRHGIYPIYFVWETGLFETIGQLLDRTRSRARAGARDIFDLTTDPLVERAVRALGAPTIWGGMKRSAERASLPGTGGARHTARKLAEFMKQHGEQTELHALGHSAGSIFHAHFLPAALQEMHKADNKNRRAFRSVHFLAPAVRSDLFKDQLVDLLGAGIEHLTMYTMKQDLERADSCKGVYRKSLLYLVSRALEGEPDVPLLGLEEAVRADLELRRIFALGNQPSPVAEVVWSPSPGETGRSASRSTTHGGFDDDAPTMNSVVRRVLGMNDADALRVAFAPAARARGSDWESDADWPDALGAEFPPSSSAESVAAAPAAPALITSSGDGGRGGRRRALCIGIDAYPTAPLAGCVADARLWARTLRNLGFEEPELLLNEQATRSRILDRLTQLVRASSAGDVVVFQYAGHGTQLPDLNGDEAGGDTPGKDEALCPHDMATGAYVIDDDLGRIFDTLPEGVNLTCFMDCCHSGTISRLGVGTGPLQAGGDHRARYLAPTAAMEEAHAQFRSRVADDVVAARGPERLKEVLFSACLSSEVAWESNGQGEFTLRATQILQPGIANLTNEQFQQRVRKAFGPSPRQHPELMCAPGVGSRALLAPLTSAASAPATTAVPAVSSLSHETLREILRLLSQFVRA